MVIPIAAPKMTRFKLNDDISSIWSNKIISVRFYLTEAMGACGVYPVILLS